MLHSDSSGRNMPAEGSRGGCCDWSWAGLAASVMGCLPCSSPPSHSFAVPPRPSSLLVQELGEGPWSQPNLDPGSSLLIPVRGSPAGAVVVGESYVMFVGPGGAVKSAGMPPTLIRVRRQLTQVDVKGGRGCGGESGW